MAKQLTPCLTREVLLGRHVLLIRSPLEYLVCIIFLFHILQPIYVTKGLIELFSTGKNEQSKLLSLIPTCSAALI